MRAWLIFTDTRKYPYLFFEIEAVVVQRVADLVCHTCPDSYDCHHVRTVERTFWGYDSPFVEMIEVRDEMQAVDVGFQRRFIEARSRTLAREEVSTNFIEL
jgi:hypothetical protein